MVFHVIARNFKVTLGDLKGRQCISRYFKALQGIARDLMGYHGISHDFKVHSPISSILLYQIYQGFQGISRDFTQRYTQLYLVCQVYQVY